MNLCFSPPKKDSCHESSFFDEFWSHFGGSEKGRGSILAPFREVVEDLGSVCLDFAAILHDICAFSNIWDIFWDLLKFEHILTYFWRIFAYFGACLCVLRILACTWIFWTYCFGAKSKIIEKIHAWILVFWCFSFWGMFGRNLGQKAKLVKRFIQESQFLDA